MKTINVSTAKLAELYKVFAESESSETISSIETFIKMMVEGDKDIIKEIAEKIK